ncbi:hypothetical protein HDR58_09930 [bacterium]|nr:hypothetical protein [bacterium]
MVAVQILKGIVLALVYIFFLVYIYGCIFCVSVLSVVGSMSVDSILINHKGIMDLIQCLELSLIFLLANILFYFVLRTIHNWANKD